MDLLTADLNSGLPWRIVMSRSVARNSTDSHRVSPRCRGAAVATFIFSFVTLGLIPTTDFSIAQEWTTADQDAQRRTIASLVAALPDCVYYSQSAAGNSLHIELKACDAASVHKTISLLQPLQVPLSIDFTDGVRLSAEDCDGLSKLESLSEISFEGAVVSGADLARFFSNYKGNALVRLTLPEKTSFDDPHPELIFPASLRRLVVNGSTLPVDTWKALASADNLTFLSVLGRPVPEDAWTWIKQMKQLRTLALEIGTADDTTMSHLASLRGLEELVINGGSLDYDSAMELSWSLLKCKNLSLWNMSLDQGVIAAFSSLPALQGVRLAGCDLHSSNITDLSKLDGLQILSLTGLRLAPEGVIRLPSLRHLEQLELTATDVDQKTIALLSTMGSLELLKLAHTSITDEMMEHITAIPNLRSLDLLATLITDKGMEALRNHAHLHDLNLRQTQVTPKSLAVIATLPALKSLGFTGISLKGAAFAELKDNLHLEALYVQECDINDDMLAEILEIPNLKILHLSRNPEVTSLSMQRILNHPSLEKISVEGCSIDETDLRRLKARFQFLEIKTPGGDQR